MLAQRLSQRVELLAGDRPVVDDVGRSQIERLGGLVGRAGDFESRPLTWTRHPEHDAGIAERQRLHRPLLGEHLADLERPHPLQRVAHHCRARRSRRAPRLMRDGDGGAGAERDDGDRKAAIACRRIRLCDLGRIVDIVDSRPVGPDLRLRLRPRP